MAGRAPFAGAGAARLLPPLGLAALAAYAYRDLLLFEPERNLPAELEQWFFVPSESLTPIVVGLSLWLLFRRRERLQGLHDCPQGSLWAGLVLAAAGAGLHGWATRVGAIDLLAPALALTGLAWAWLWRGAAAVRAAWLPVALLVFVLPIPAPLRNEIAYLLQIWTAELAGAVLYLMGIPHLVAAEQVLRPSESFSVIESCNGLRSMEILTIVSILMMDLFRRRGLHACLVVGLAAPVAFLLNGLRAVLLILNPYSAIASVHSAQGVAILLLGLVTLFLLDGLLERLLGEPAPGASAAPASSGPAAAQRGRAAGLLRNAPVAAALLLGCLAPVWAGSWSAAYAPQFGSIKPSLWEGLGRGEELPIEREFLGSTRFREGLHERFGSGETATSVFALMATREQRGSSVLSPKTAQPGPGWMTESEEWAPLEPGGEPVRIRVLRHGPYRHLVADWVKGAGGIAEESLRAGLAIDRRGWASRGPIFAVRLDTRIVDSGPAGMSGARERLAERARALEQGIEAAEAMISFATQLAPRPRD